MIEPISLFQIVPRYAIDTNVIVAFMRDSDEEQYSRKAFGAQWNLIETLIGSGEIVAPERVEHELHGWEDQIPDMNSWVAHRKGMFLDLTDEQLVYAKHILNNYPDYGSDENYIADLEIIALAGVLRLTVVTLEQPRPIQSLHQPKIPEVCSTLGVKCLSVNAFLIREQDKLAS